jgi:hypothetical protein
VRTALWSSVFALVSAVSAFPDTVTKTDHLSVNGSLKQMSSGVITLEAQFGSGTKTLLISINEVESIEFNNTTFNPGAPPKALGITPPPSTSKLAFAADQLILRGNQRKGCKLIGIDQQYVHCAVKGEDYARKVTLRIQVGVP